MTITTNILDVFPPGEIISASFMVINIISLTVSRSNLNALFLIISCDVQSSDEVALSQPGVTIKNTMREQGIEIVIPPKNI